MKSSIKIKKKIKKKKRERDFICAFWGRLKTNAIFQTLEVTVDCVSD